MQKKRIFQNEAHKKLIDLVTWLPFGYSAECFYQFILCMLKKRTNAEIFELYPADIRKQILRDLEILDQRKEEQNETKVKKELSEKDMFLCSSVNMLSKIEREDAQRYLNIIIKDVFEEVQHE